MWRSEGRVFVKAAIMLICCLALISLVLLPTASLPAQSLSSAEAAGSGSWDYFLPSSTSVVVNGAITFSFQFTVTGTETMIQGTVDIQDNPDLSLTDPVFNPYPLVFQNKTPGSACYGTATYRVIAPAGSSFIVSANLTMITSTGTYYFPYSSGIQINVSQGQRKLVVQKQITSPVDGIVASGGPATFRITAANTSTISATAPVITDALPASFDPASVGSISAYIGTTATTPVYTRSGNQLYFSFPSATIPQTNGVLQVYFTANALTFSATTAFTNTAQASAAGFAISDPAAVSGSIVPGQTSFTKSANKTSAAPGDTITYTIQLNNVGQAAFTSAQIIDYIPTYTVFQSASFVSPSVGASITLPDPTAGRNYVTWNLGSVATNAWVTAILNVQVINDQGLMGYTVANTAQLTGYQNSIYVDKSASAPAVSISGAPFTIIKTVSPTLAQPGQHVSFGIKVKNNSPTNAVNNFTVTDNLDSRLVNPGVGAASSLAGTISGNQVYWGGTGTTIQPNTEMNFYFTAMVNYNLTPGTQIPNTAQVSGLISSIPSPLPASASSNTVIIVVESMIHLQKSVVPTDVLAGQSVHFVISLQNDSNATIPDARIVDTVDSRFNNLRFQGSPPSQTGNILTWILGSIAVGQQVTLSFDATVDPSQMPGSVIPNSATLYSGLTIIGSAPAVTVTLASTIAIPLTSGWNMIGFPYVVPIAWSQIQVSKDSGPPITMDQAVVNGWLAKDAFTWNQNAYVSVASGGSFLPLKGYWVRALQSGISLLVPAP